VLARAHAVAGTLWSSIAGGAAAGFLARDALGLEQPLVALAWTAGAMIPLAVLVRERVPIGWRRALARRRRAGGRSPRAAGHAPPARGRRGPRGERGQATVELVSLVLLLALAFGALVALSPRFDGRSFGGSSPSASSAVAAGPPGNGPLSSGQGLSGLPVLSC
jgi:hypothetical protein